MSEGSGKTAIIVALITVVGSVLTAGIANWDKFFPPAASSPEKNAAPVSPPNQAPPNRGGAANNDRPQRRDDPPLDFSDLSRRLYRVGVVTFQDIRLNPMPPAVLTQNQAVNVRFSYDVCCGASVHFWVRPVLSGGQCSDSFTGSPPYSGRGAATSVFAMRGADCRSTRITGIRLSVKNDDNAVEDMTVIPVQYKFSG
jgi:hypothetical protein